MSYYFTIVGQLERYIKNLVRIWSDVHTKGQLISKQNCRAITSPKNKHRISALEVYYFKVSTKESL